MGLKGVGSFGGFGFLMFFGEDAGSHSQMGLVSDSYSKRGGNPCPFAPVDKHRLKAMCSGSPGLGFKFGV